MWGANGDHRHGSCEDDDLRDPWVHRNPLFLANPKEGKDIPVGIADFEAPQTVVYERQLFAERHTPLAKLVEERVGIQGVDVRIPTSPRVSGVVGTRKDVGKDGL